MTNRVVNQTFVEHCWNFLYIIKMFIISCFGNVGDVRVLECRHINKRKCYKNNNNQKIKFSRCHFREAEAMSVFQMYKSLKINQ